MKAGVDLAFIRNSTALVIGDGRAIGRDPTGASLMHTTVATTRAWLPDGSPLDPRKVCREIARDCAAAGVTVVSADGHYVALLMAELEDVRIEFEPAPSTPWDAWEPTQLAFLEGRIDVPFDEDLRAELQAARVTYETGGRTVVHLETTADGSHSDKAAALALCVWLTQRAEESGRMLGGSTVRTEYTRARRPRFG